MKHPTKIVIGIAVAISLVAVGLVLSDIAADRTLRVAVTGSVPMYADWESAPGRASAAIARVGPAENLSVLRVRYGKDFMAIRVRRADGVDGWILGDDAVQVSK